MQRTEFYFLIIISITTIGLQLYHFGLPRLWPDELPFILMGQTLLNPPGSDLYNYAMGFGVHLGPFPLNYAPYNAVLSSYLTIPFVHFLGLSVTAVRSYQMVTTLSIVILMYFAGKELFSRRAGMISSAIITTFPLFVFYSRQSITYDWILLSFALLIIISGIRFMKNFKKRYLFVSLFLIGIGIWDYLWFAWFVIGLLVTMPIWLRSFRSRLNDETTRTFSKHGKSVTSLQLKHDKIKFSIVSIIALISGFTPVIIGSFTPDGSVIQFVLKTLGIGGKTTYLIASNSTILQNLILRAQHLLEVLEFPQRVGLIISGVNGDALNEISYVFPFLFSISTIASIIYIIYKKPQSKKVAGILLIIVAMFLSSIFTVTAFTVLQHANIVPFIVLAIGIGIDIIVTNKPVTSLLYTRKKISSTHLAIGVIVVITLFQIPILEKGFELIQNSPSAYTQVAYENMYSYLMKNHLKFVSFDFFTDKTLPFYTDGKLVPAYKIHYGTIPYFEFDNKTKESMPKLESFGLLNKEYLFVIYVYPQIQQCDANYRVSPDQSNYCAQFYFVESAAERNGLHYEIKDFSLPDGTPFFRTYRFVD